MGKHERELIKKAEKIIVKLLNSQKLRDSDKKNHWFQHAVFLAEKIKKDFPNIKESRHLGNRYDNAGDILIIANSKKFFIEIKMSDTKLGIGTKANISQNAITQNNLFVGKVKSWSQFRDERKHDEWVNKYLDQFPKYTKNIFKITNSTKEKEEKARYLRNLAKKGNKKSRNILNNIREKDRAEKIDYLNYLSNQKQRKKAIERFFILITLGIHDKDEIKTLMARDDFFKEIQNLYIYYANFDKGKIITRKEDTGKRIEEIIKKYSNFKVVFPKGLTHCKIIAATHKKSKPLLQIVFHWKNIAQGIKTPCLNIFDLTNKFI